MSRDDSIHSSLFPKVKVHILDPKTPTCHFHPILLQLRIAPKDKSDVLQLNT